MALDGITCQLLANELNESLSGLRIDKVFMPDRTTVVLHIRGSSGIKKVLLSINPGSPRINITDNTRENPQMPPSFCMLLRKYIAGAHINKVTNPGYERIIEIHLSNTDELRDSKNYRLIVELMGRFSNIILVNQSNKIIDSAVHVDFSVSRVREVMPARIYDYPPTQDKLIPEEILDLTTKGLLPIIDSELNRPMEKALVNSIKGLSPLLARQLCLKANVDDRTTSKDLNDKEKSALINEINEFSNDILNKSYSPYIYFSDEGEPTEYSPMKLIGYAREYQTSSISEAIDSYYKKKDQTIDLDNKKQRLLQITNSALSKLIKKQEIHRNDEEEGLKSEKYKLWGDLILSYTYMIKPNQELLVCQDYTSDPIKDVEIKLDPRLSPAQNSQEYYKLFRKNKRKLSLAKEYLEEDKMAIDYLRSLKTAILSASCTEDIEALNQEINESFNRNDNKKEHKQNQGDPNKTVGKAKSGKASSRALREAAKRANSKQKNSNKTQKALPFRKYITSDGYTILCGRNNIQNEQLTFQVADRNDWWFHVKGLPGTHVILKSHLGEEFPSDEAMLEAASCAAWFSKNTILEEHQATIDSKAGKIKVEIDYCPVSHVKKIPKAKPGMVIYEGYYSMNVIAKEPSNPIE